MRNFSFYPKLLMRAPVRPIDIHFTKNTLICLLNDPEFMESIYVASPFLYSECYKWKQNQREDPDQANKLFISLAKYYMRMSSRATPFGLFSGCTTIEWKDETPVFEWPAFQRHTRFDMHCLCLLTESIAKKSFVKSLLSYFPNTSLYQIGKSLRYIEYVYQDGYRKYQISSVPCTPHIQSVLEAAKDGAKYHDLLKNLHQLQISRQDAAAYLDELIESQILVSNLEIAITDGDQLHHIISVLESIAKPHKIIPELSKLTNDLREVKNTIKILDQTGANGIAAYQTLAEKFVQFDIPVESGKLFQVDLVNSSCNETVPINMQAKLTEAIKVCEYFTEAPTKSRLNKFQQTLMDRYGTQEMPLLEMLDDDCGIGYNKLSEESNSAEPGTALVTDNIGRALTWTTKTQFLFNKLITAIAEGQQSINLEQDEINTLPQSETVLYPPSLSVTFRCFQGENEAPQLFFESAQGSSAVNLLARFAYADDAITNWCADIVDHEEQTNSDVCFAEIVHLPERRTGNILLHPAFRKKEIPFLARSSRTKENQVDPADLLVSVVAGNIMLRDKRTGSQVIPRLSSAHNYSLNPLPLYCFLGDLQHQQLRNHISFSWGPLEELFRFFPRVSYQGIVLSPAGWNILGKELEPILNQPISNWDKKIRSLMTAFKLPSIFLLCDGDNQLPVFTANELSVTAFFDTIKKRTSIRLQEIPGVGIDPQPEQFGALTRQYIASILQTTPVYQQNNRSGNIDNTKKIQREFIPGTEWVYFKLYCSEKQADRILTGLVSQLVTTIKQKRIADKWFFIRYRDPDFHIRLRFHSADPRCIPEIIELVSKEINAYTEPGIWKTQLDTYDRELERYGSATITNSEIIFCADSEAVLQLVQESLTTTNTDLKFLWLMFSIDQALNAFGFSPISKLQLVEGIRNGLSRLFHADKHTTKHLDTHYRRIRQQTEAILAGDTSIWTPGTKQQLINRAAILRQEAARIIEIFDQQQTTNELNDLLCSYIHMTCNRVFSAHSRKQEFVVYDLMLRFYRSKMAREKQAGTEAAGNYPANMIL